MVRKKRVRVKTEKREGRGGRRESKNGMM